MKHPSAHARETPDKAAYIMAKSGEVVTYAALDRASNQAAHLLRSIGVRPGDHIAILMENSARFFEIVWGAQRAGIIFTAISSHLQADEIAYVVGNCDAKALIASQRLAPIARTAFAQCFRCDHLFASGGESPGCERWDEACARMPVEPIADECAGVHMLYSSGTTGYPKGVYPVWSPGRPIDHIEPGMAALRDYFRIDEASIYLSPAPLYHAAPLIFNQLVMFQGGTSIIMEKFDAAEALELIDRHRVSIAQFVPIMFSRMLKLDASERSGRDLSSLRYAIHAAAPCPPDVKRAMINWWGPILFEYYSSTENAGATLLDTQQWLEHPGSVGRPLGCIIHILDEEGAEQPVGEVGDIYFENPRLNFEYYKDPEKTAKTRNESGWVSVGDMGYVDKDGYLYLTDRKDFLIISGGVNIYPQEVENVLATHGQVADVAVFGVPDTEFGEQVKAVVQPARWEDAGPALEQELIAWCRERIAHFKAPKSIDFRQTLPRLDNGKLYKKQLAETYRD